MYPLHQVTHAAENTGARSRLLGSVRLFFAVSENRLAGKVSLSVLSRSSQGSSALKEHVPRRYPLGTMFQEGLR